MVFVQKRGFAHPNTDFAHPDNQILPNAMEVFG